MKRAILLNGPSGSGKSSLAAELKKLIENEDGKSCFVVSIDDFMHLTREEPIYEDDVFDISGDMCKEALRLLDSGAVVIIDHVITSRRIYDGLTEALAGRGMMRVRTDCPLDVLIEREKARGDRCPGSAEASLAYLYPKDGYDLTVDTGRLSPGEAAAAVRDELMRENSPVRAVIFDLDGTLTDTEVYFQQAWAEAAARFGYELDSEKTLALRSLGTPFVDAQLKEWFGAACRPSEMRAECHLIFNAIAKERGVRLKPGAKELLARLKELGVIIALATSGNSDRATKQLTETGVIGFFDRIICANMVPQGKPAPDTYLHACGVLGIEPREAIAVEDSPNGVRSAFKAGCRVVMIPELTEPDDELAPMLFARADSLADVAPLVAQC